MVSGPSGSAVAAVTLAMILWPIIHGRSYSRFIALIYLPATIIGHLSFRWSGFGDPTSSWNAIVFIVTHVSAMVLISALFRLSPFHPLASFPGPILFKLTNIRLALSVASGHRYLEMDRLHKKYGKIVRIGPNKLSILSTSALHNIYKSSRCMDKSDAYELGHARHQGIFFMTNRDNHSHRRAIWAPAFSNSIMDQYQPTLDKSICELTECIVTRKNAKGVVHLGDCFQHWSFDFMGHITFGSCNSFDMMRQGDPQNLVSGGQLAMVNFEILGEVPWLFKIVWHLPLAKSLHALHDFADSMTKKRKAAGAPVIPDVCSFLLGEDGSSCRLNDEELALDSLFAIQAGSDTTSGILTGQFFHLLSNPTELNKLQTELDAAFPDPEDPTDLATLYKLPYLNAVIKEALRLCTPFGGLARVIPAGGAVLEGFYVPSGTVVSVPVYAEHVAENHFWPEPTRFLPERWLPGGLGPHAVCDEAAMIAFSFGPFGCLGKNLAMRQLLTVTARMVLAFDMCFPPGFNKEEFQRNILSMKTILYRKPLKVVIHPRKASGVS